MLSFYRRGFSLGKHMFQAPTIFGEYVPICIDVILWIVQSATDALIHCQDATSSTTAWGGGGSFKNRKPIGGIGCCESRMAEQKHWWIELSNCVTD